MSMRSSEITEEKQLEDMENIEPVKNLKQGDMESVEQFKELKQESTVDSQKVYSNKVSSADAKIIALKRATLRQSAFDRREIVMPLLKNYIQSRLESKVEEATRLRDDPTM